VNNILLAAGLGLFVIGAAIAAAAWVVSETRNSTLQLPRLEATLNYGRRLWMFWGPRFTDRGFVAGVLANFAMLGMFSAEPDVLNVWTTLLWIAANFFFPTWDALPAGEKLRPSPNGLARGVNERDSLQTIIREGLRAELDLFVAAAK
jgi:hypothetical protein